MIKLAFDLESNGFIREGLSKIHCISIEDIDTNENILYTDIEEAVKRLNEADVIIGHNIIKYDIPALKYCGLDIKPKKVIDTFVLSSLFFKSFPNDARLAVRGRMDPKLINRHSLKAWGYRLGCNKDEKPLNWEYYTDEMGEYCQQDVRVTVALYNKLMEVNKTGSWDKAIANEHRVWEIIAEQIQTGVVFDIEEACRFQGELRLELLKMEDDLRSLFPSRIVAKNKKPFTPKKDNARFNYKANCPMTHIKFTEFNPNSTKDIIYWFTKKYNWIPDEFTEKGNPKVDGDILESLPYPEAKTLAKFKMINKIYQFFESKGGSGWLKLFHNETGRIYGDVHPNGAVTNRMTHNKPNLAQIPAHSDLGSKCRELFTVPEDYVLLGIDADGLELRMLSHYMYPYDKGAYGETVVNGDKSKGTDIHTVNTKAAGLDDRDQGKTFIYAFMYGAGNGKLGSIVGGEAKEGARLRAKFLKAIPALKKLIDAVQTKAKAGYVRGLDGRKIYIRSEHAALNSLLQSAGAIVMKYALVILDDKIKEHKLDARFVLNVHDEFQLEVHKDHAEQLGSLAEQSLIDAGKQLGIRIPITGTYAVGQTWKETH